MRNELKDAEPEGIAAPRRARRKAGRRAAPRRTVPRGLVWALIALVTVALAVGGVLLNRAINQGEPTGTPLQSGAVDPLSLIQVSGRVGATPVVSVGADLTGITGTKRRTVEVGTGRQIQENSPVLIAVTAFDAGSGVVLSPSGLPQLTVGPASTDGIGADLAQAVIGQTEGTRLLYVRQVAEGARAEGATSNVEINVVDILWSVAQGEPGSEADVAGPLEVTIGDEGPVIRHGEDAPEEVSIQTLIQGVGPQVRSQDRLVVQFIITGWTDGAVRDSTWSTGLPMVMRMDQAMPGLQQAIVDKRIGSRLAITIPPALATGDDTLCVVIDLLGAEPAPVVAGGSDPGTSSTGTQSSGAQ